MKQLLRILTITCFSCAVATAESYQWTNPSSGNWNDSSNWTPSQVPGTGDTASIPGNGLTIAINSTISISGLSIGGGSSLMVDTGGVLNIGGNVDLYGSLTNAGTVNWQDGRIDLRRSSGYIGKITNLAGASFDIRCDQTISGGFPGTTNQFTNEGILRKSISTGTTVFAARLENNSTVEALAGTLHLSRGTNLGGTFQAAANSAINITGANLTIQSTPNFQGPGIVKILSSTVVLDQFNGTLDLTDCRISGVIASGSILNLQGGSVLNNTSLSISSGGIFNLLGALSIKGTVTNSGVIRWQSGDIAVDNNNYDSFGSVINAAAGVFDIRSELALIYLNGSGPFNNQGILRKSSGMGLTEFSVHFDNSGTVEAETGTLRFSGGTNLGGTFQAAADAVIDVAGSNLMLSTTPSFQGPGTLRITTSNVTLDNFSGTVNLTGSSVSGQLAAGAILNLHGGTVTNFSTLNVATGGVFNILGNLRLEGALINAGTVNWQDGDINYPYISFVQTTSEITNQLGGLFDIRCDRSINNGSYTFKEFRNAGILRKSAGTGTSEFSVSFDNSGTVEAETGTLRFSGGTNLGGTFQAAADAVIDVAGSNLTLSTTPLFQGAGTVRITASNVILDNFSGTVALTAVNVSGQIATGAILNLHGGTIPNSSTLNVATGGVFNILGNLRLEGALINAGTVNWQDGDINYPYISFVQTTSEITNQLGGLFDIRCDRSINNGSYTFKEFRNAGILRKSAGTHTSEFSVHFDNSGTVEVETGTLRFSGGTNLGGTFQAAAEAVIDVAGSNLTLSTTPLFQGAGTVRITASNVILDNFSGTVALTAVNVSGQIATGAILNLHGGTIPNSSTLNVATGGVFNILGNLRLEGALINAGTVNWQDGNIIYPYISFVQTTSEITNQLGGLFDIRCDRNIYSDFNFYKEFHNAGTLRKSTGTATSEFFVHFDNSGSVEAETGTLRFNSGYSGEGALELLLTLSENMPDRISITGSTPVSFAGKLTFRMDNGYRPTSGEIFPVMTYPKALGDFTCLNGLDLGNGLRLEPHFNANKLTLVATTYENSAIPTLNIVRANSGVFISWPLAASGWELYRSTNLAIWNPTTIAGENNTIKPISEVQEFFRLEKP